jgi:hypothetical protein
MRIVGAALLILASEARGILRVGPGQPFARIEEAHAKAQAGDVIEVYPGPYEKVAVYVTQKNLTFRAVAAKKGERVRLSGKGFDYSGEGRTPRAIFQFNPGADGGRVEGFELTGATNGSDNGAGVRINGAHRVTISDCGIHGNDMGIMSNGAADQTIEHCRIHENGSERRPGLNHNLYLGGESVTLRFCEVDRSLTGHNVKSRARVTRVEYCYIHDSANREFDLVDAAETAAAGSHAWLVGNLIVKARDMKGNKGAIHFGQDGGGERDGTIYLIHNTIVHPYVSPLLDLSASRARARLIGNIVWDGGRSPGKQEVASGRNGADTARVEGHANWFSSGFGLAGTKLDPSKNAQGRDPGFADPSKGDYRLKTSIPGPTLKELEGERLEWQYKHPCGKEKRTHGQKVELGGFSR